MNSDASFQPFISIVIPSFNESENIPILASKLKPILESIGTWEMFFIDDGSSDGTREVLKTLNKEDSRIRYVCFSRNFGHQDALRAGLERVHGDCIVSMDGDLQHPPELVPDLVDRFRQGYDVVYTLRQEEKKLPIFKRITSSGFYHLINTMSDIKIEDGAADFRLLSRKALQAMLSFSEHGVFWRGVVPWIGFRQCAIPYVAAPRLYGETKYSLRKMFRFALDGITSFSVKPLHLTTSAGAIISLFAFLYAAYALLMHLFSDKTVAGWTSILISVLFIGGIQLISLGILGEYIGKLFMEAKKRPHYIIMEESE
jgi:polyisoprenyl-phosphate glycosyltransferase